MKGIVHFDGGSRNNGHKNPERQCYAAGAAVLTWTGPTAAAGIYIGDATNNEAEYASLILALDLAKSLDVVDLIACGDSKLIVQQSMNQWDVNSETLQPYWETVQEKLEHFHDVNILHVPRKENATADRLVNWVLDKKGNRRPEEGEVLDLSTLVHPR